MDADSLAAFLEIADAGSFSAAAERLHLSQPAISKRIAGLEERLAARLFDRIGRRVLLTEAGRTLLPYAQRVREDLEDGRRALSHLSPQLRGRLTLGTSHHIGLHRLPVELKSFAHDHPDVDLDIQFMDSEVACEAVLAGKLELGIVTLPNTPLPGLESQLIWQDPLAVVVSPEHALAKRQRVTPAELARHAAVLPDEATYTHRIIKAELAKHGIQPRVRLATNYLETLKMLVGIGLGWSVLPRSMLDRSVRALAIPGFAPSRSLGAVWHRKRTLSAPARRLLEHLGRKGLGRKGLGPKGLAAR
ncbi:MAG: LysR family transcriptional regulator [Nevskiaceae bacterium]